MSAVNKEKYKRNSSKEEEEKHVLNLDFGDTPEKVKGKYLDMFEGIKSEILSTIMFDENSDLSTTYLGRVNMTKNSKIKVEESFPISEQGCTMGKV